MELVLVLVRGHSEWPRMRFFPLDEIKGHKHISILHYSSNYISFSFLGMELEVNERFLSSEIPFPLTNCLK